MVTNLLSWMTMGIVAGFLVNWLFPTDEKHYRGTISAGILGAFCGGIFYSLFQIGSVAFNLDPSAAFIALLGALGLIVFMRMAVTEKETVKTEQRS